MAGGMSVPTKGGRKALDAAINLVPFIDLLSCCISFLLITAVWTQLASLPVSRGGGGEGGDPPDVQLTLEVRGNGFLLRKSTGEQLPVSAPAGGTGFVELAALLKQVKEQHPHTDDITVQADDRVPYERVIRTLDTLRGARFPAIRVSDR